MGEPRVVSDIFDPHRWRTVTVPGAAPFTDITYHRAVDPGTGADRPTVRIAFDRPEVRNAFRPHTVDELLVALDHARMSNSVGCVLLTGNGPSPRDGGWAFCSGGDQRIRGRDGYRYTGGGPGTTGDPDVTDVKGVTGDTDVTGVTGDTGGTDVADPSDAGPGPADRPGTDRPSAAGAEADRDSVEPGRAGRLHILEVQRLIRTMPKVVIAVVPGWAAGGGHSLHVVCDLTLASREFARFKQTDADVASFDGGYGSAYLARMVGAKFAREIFFLGREYSAAQMHAMGAVNAVVDHAELEDVALQWADEITAKSPTAQRMLKYAFNLPDDGLMGQQLFAGEATRLAYGTDEAVEGRDSFLQKRPADFSGHPWAY